MSKLKQLHIRLDSADQIADYDLVRGDLGIRSDSDLVRHLLRKEATKIRERQDMNRRAAIVVALAQGEVIPDDAHAAWRTLATTSG